MSSRQLLAGIFEIIKTFAIVLVLAFLLKTFLIQTFIIEGQSMEPNFHSGQYLLIDKLSYRLSEPKRGDVVILVPPDDLTKDYIKRVIGLPGDTVEIREGKVRVNGALLPEPYLLAGQKTIASDVDKENLRVTVPADSFFVLGDNRNNSRDSRSIGPVPRENIIGRTLLVILPYKDLHLVRHPSYQIQPSSS